MRFRVYAKVVGTKFIGEIEAEEAEEAESKAWGMEGRHGE